MARRLGDLLDGGLLGSHPRGGRVGHRGRSAEGSMRAMAGPPLRVMLVDDHEVVRSGIRSMLQATDDIVVTAEAGSVREAIDEAERSRPDVVVMDVRLIDGSGIEATREIRARRPATRVLMLTSFADDEALFASIMAGASGYVLKQVKSGDLLRAIRAVGAGERLQLAEKTVKNYVSSILSKLEVARRAEAAAYLARHTTTPGSIE